MASANRWIGVGNLTRDPELRFTQGGVPVASFGIAINRPRSKTEEVDFFDVNVWRELGETVANYKKKGDQVYIEGRLQYRTWEAQDGSKRSKVDIVADNIQFLRNAGDRKDEGGHGARQRQESDGARRNTGRGGREQAVGVDESDFEDIPF